jgi:excisionase family DNA binding protein
MKKREPHFDRIAYRPASLAVSLGVSEGFVRNEIRQGRLKAKKLGRAVLVLATDVEDYLERKRQESGD